MPSQDIPTPYQRSWRPTPFIVAIIVVHVFWLAGLVWVPSAWLVWLLVLLGIHVLLSVPGCMPYSTLYGPNLRRLAPAALPTGREVALTFDDGPDPAVTPEVLAILAKFDVRASFFMIGERAARHPELVRAVVAAGHRVENHTHRHRPTFAFNIFPFMLREVRQAQRTLISLAGDLPRFFRAPAGMHNFFVDPVLCRLGLTYVSWTRRGYDTVDGDPRRVLARLLTNLAAGDILLLHDGNAALGPGGQPVVLAVLPTLLEELQRRGLSAIPLPPVEESRQNP